MIGVASLSLAACGSGGDGESTDPASKSALDARKKELARRETTVSAKEKSVASREAAVSAKENVTRWAGLTATEAAYAAWALELAATSFPLFSKPDDNSPFIIQQMIT